MMYNRFPHVMRVKKKTVTPSNFIFFDTETRVDGTKNKQGDGRHVLWFGWAYAYRLENGKKTREVWLRFTTPSQFFEFVISRVVKNKPLMVYAHNLGFDLTIVDFMNQFRRNAFTIQFHTFNSPPTIFKCRHQGDTIVFVDTLNYWTIPLSKLGLSVGLPKLEMPAGKLSKKLWDKYARRDVEIIALAVERLCLFVHSHNCGSIGYTLATLAMNAFRCSHLKHDIYIHDRAKVIDLERKAYYGGLVQCYYIGKVPAKVIYNLDINSHYPSMMMNCYPTKLITDVTRCSLDQLKCHMKSNLVIARVTIQSGKEVFPYRDKKTKKLLYCKGTFQTTLTTPELERALENRCIKTIHHVAVYKAGNIFQSFVSYFWRLRQQYLKQGDEVNAFFCKILLNSLYGKFGQKGVAWVDFTQQVFERLAEKLVLCEAYTKPQDFPIETSGYYNFTPLGCEETLSLRTLFSTTEIKVPIGEHSESFPAIAAFVTAYGREFLLNAVRIAGPNNCYYTDTDSLFVNQAGYLRIKQAKLIARYELGKLKISKKGKSMWIYGPKDYVFDDEKVIKGIRKDAEVIGHNKFRQVKFEGLRSIIRRGGEGYVTISRVTKTLSRRYDKGKIQRSGFVTPLIKFEP